MCAGIILRIFKDESLRRLEGCVALNEINSFNSLVWCLNLARLGKHSYNFERENIMDYIRDRGEPAKRFPLHRIKPKLIYNGNMVL